MNQIYKEVANRKTTAQTEQARPEQVQNNAGGFVFEVDLWERVRRFLILGSSEGTYYVGAQTLTRENAACVSQAVKADTTRLVDLIVSVSSEGLAAKNSPAIFALAIALADAEEKDKLYVRQAVNQVVRTGTHLFEFAEYLKNLGGWGRAKRKAVAGWYESKTPDQLAYQSVKYRQRNGWTHRDALRISHARGLDANVADFITGRDAVQSMDFRAGAPEILGAFKAMQRQTDVRGVVDVLQAFTNLPWETIPTQFLREPEIWKALFYNGALGQTALLRNITRFQEIGAFKDLKFAGDVARRLADPEDIAKGRMHPIAYLNALSIYRNGRMVQRGGWGYGGRSGGGDTNAKVLGALEAGFYAAFGNVTPADKRTRIALDVSGSMTWAAPAGLVGMDCREASAAMAMVTLRTEPYVEVTAFSHGITPVNLGDKDDLATVERKISALPMGGTDCSLPMVDAMNKGIEIDTFIVYTDNETWAGKIHPFQALKQYRNKMGIPAKLIVVGMVSTGFTIADPSDAGMLDVVGFDASAPAVMSDFSAGR